MDGRAVELNRPSLRLGQRRVALVLRERRFRGSDMFVPGGDGRGRQFGCRRR